jgi:hypothetical protein
VAAGMRNIVLAPLHYQDKVIGILELSSARAGDLDPLTALKLREVLPLFSMAVSRSLEELEARVQAIIKEKFARGRRPFGAHQRPTPGRRGGRPVKGYSSVLGLGVNGSHRGHEAKPPVHECLPPGGAPPRALGAQPERDPQNTQRRFTAP